MKMKIKKTRLQEIIQEEYTRHEKMKLRESIEGLDGKPPSKRELIGNELASSLEGALEQFLVGQGIDTGVITNVMLDVEDKLLDVAIAVSHTIKNHANQGIGGMDEDALSQAIAEVLAEEGLGDGEIMGGNYSTGYGGPGSSEQSTLPEGRDGDKE